VNGRAGVFNGDLDGADVLCDGGFLIVATGRESQTRILGQDGSGE